MSQLAAIFFCLLPLALHSQSEWTRVEGKILDTQSNLPVAYASISIENTGFGTTSNVEGDFTLNFQTSAKLSDVTIRVTSIGWETARVKFSNFNKIIFLKSTTIELKEVTVFVKDPDPAQVARKAFSRIRKNYYTKPFVYKTFYRHYCQDDTTYGRLIEAAIDIYKRKGYKASQPHPGYKEEMRATQLRRSFDNTNLKANHVAIALNSVLAIDPVAYQKSSSSTVLWDFIFNVSTLKRLPETFHFEFDGITTFDGEEVYKIKYTSKSNGMVDNTMQRLRGSESGNLYINSKNFAIIRSEYKRVRELDTTTALTIYKEIGDRYFHQYSMKEGSTFMPKQNFTHKFHLELMTSDVIVKNFEEFRGKEPDRETLLKLDYDSAFWNTYNILKATPLEEQIAADLQTAMPLDNQYHDYIVTERKQYFGGKEDEQNFNKFLNNMRGVRPIYIQVWASDCEPCRKNMVRAKKIFELYKTKLSFVFLSLDDDIDAWRKSIGKLGLTEPAMKHFRVGSNADAIISFSMTTLPHYILVDKSGYFYDLNAKPPNDFNLIKDIEMMLEGSEK